MPINCRIVKSSTTFSRTGIVFSVIAASDSFDGARVQNAASLLSLNCCNIKPHAVCKIVINMSLFDCARSRISDMISAGTDSRYVCWRLIVPTFFMYGRSCVCGRSDNIFAQYSRIDASICGCLNSACEYESCRLLPSSFGAIPSASQKNFSISNVSTSTCDMVTRTAYSFFAVCRTMNRIKLPS